jgi:hypothetical protein
LIKDSGRETGCLAKGGSAIFEALSLLIPGRQAIFPLTSAPIFKKNKRCERE